MKNTKKKLHVCITLALVMIFLLTSSTFATADGALPYAAVRPGSLSVFEGYYTYQENTDNPAIFSVVSEKDRFLKSLAESEQALIESRKGIAILALRVDFNRDNAAVIPYLTIRYLGVTAANIQSATIQVGNRQYDFNLYALDTGTKKGLKWEDLYVPLSENGFKMIGEILEAPEFQLVLHGNVVYRTTVKKEGEIKTIRSEIESDSFNSLEQVYNDLTSIGMGTYNLWARNLRVIQTALPGYRFDVWHTADIPMLTSQESMMLPSTGEFCTLTLGDKGVAINELEQKLIDLGFMYGAAQTTYDADTHTAVEWAQEYYHLPVNGCADLILLSHLYGLGKTNSTPIVQEKPIDTVKTEISSAAVSDTVYSIGDMNISFSDYWFANELYPSHAGMDASPRNTWDEDLCFLIVQGMVQNLSSNEWSTSRDIAGYITVNDNYRYACTIEVETDGGRSFGSQVLPLGEATVLAYATIPKALVDKVNDISFELIAGNEAVMMTYTLAQD